MIAGDIGRRQKALQLEQLTLALRQKDLERQQRLLRRETLENLKEQALIKLLAIQ